MEQADSNHREQTEQQSVPQLLAELLHMVRTFAREQLRAIVEESAAAPLRQAAKSLFIGILAAGIFGLAVTFLAVAAFLLLLEFLPAWLAVGLIGATLAALGLITLKAGSK